MGYFTCVHGHLQFLYDTDCTSDAAVRRALSDGNSSGLWRTDVYKQDRQNFMACVRRASYKVRRALIRLQPAGALNMTGQSPRLVNRSFLPPVNADPDTQPVIDAVFMGQDDRPWGSCEQQKTYDVKTQGTVAFYIVSAAYMLIHHSQYFAELQRVRFAGFVNMYLAHWRCWVIKTGGQTLANNFLTKECYTDMVVSCHEAVFQSEVFRRFAPSLPLCLIYSGSNNCENSFSSAGGYRGMHGIRNYTCKGYADYVENEYIMSVLASAGVETGRSQHAKQEWDHRCHEPKRSHSDLEQLLRYHHTKEEKVRSWNAGAADASHLAAKMGLREGITDADWRDPWAGTNEKLHVMEVARDVNDDTESESGCDDSESSDDDEAAKMLKPFDAPRQSTFSKLDLLITSSQCLGQRLRRLRSPQTVIDGAIACSCPIIHDFLFTKRLDLSSISAIVYRMSAPVPAQERKRILEEERANRYVTVPGTDVLISKEQLCEQVVQEVLRAGRVDGTSLSKDRITRIKSTAARCKLDSSMRDEPAVSGERAHLQDDLAFCFKSDGKKKLWFGKLQQMRSRAGKRTRNVHCSIDLTCPPEDLMMQLQWYHETKRGSGRYVPSPRTKDVDRTFVHVSACLGLVHFNCKRGIYTLKKNGQSGRFKRLMNSID